MLIPERAGISRLNLFLALSRTPHLLLDMATPGLAALLCLGAFPPSGVLALGLITAFAGYTAVYALNDIIDCRVDHETLGPDTAPGSKPDLDSVFVRHPLARGLLSRRDAVLWTVAWAGVAVIGAFLLNPVCPVIFLLASLMEVIYCSLLKVTWLRSVISGFVKTSGPIGALFAVNPDPPLPFLAILFLWLFFWEIGGQNVPNDLSDLGADRKIKARTVPVRFGARGAIRIILGSLLIALALSLAVFFVSPGRLGRLYPAGALLAGFYFLILPCYRLHRTGSPGDAFHLFNRASYYPLSMLLVTILSWAA
jgi:4-hydroxybenzoate polyprenyltransferase